MTNKALSRQNKTGKFVPCCAENSVPEAAGAEATSHNVFLLNRVHVNLIIRDPGAGQTKGFRPLLIFFIPSIYRIFRACQNTNIINQMFAKSLPVLDARVQKCC